MAGRTYEGFIGSNDIKRWDGVSRTFTRRTSTGGELTLNKIGSMVDVLEVYGSGTDYSQVAISNGISMVGAGNVIFLLQPGTWNITDDFTVPSNITLFIPAGAVLTVQYGKTLTVNGPIMAGSYEIFDGLVDPDEILPNGIVAGTPIIPFKDSKWFSATVTDSTTYAAGVITEQDIDDTSADAAAMQATADPYPAGAPSLATDLRGEIQRLRYLIKQITGQAHWYIDPDTSMPELVAPRDSSRGLSVTKYLTSPTDTMNITADELILHDSSGVPYRAGPGSVGRPNITASGANGLDTGSEATGVYYYIWIISDGSTVTGLLSLSKTSPTMPSGYTYKALVGQVFNSASGDFEEYGTWDGRNFLDLQQAYTLVSSLGPGSESEVVLAPGSTYANLSTRGLIIIVRGSLSHKVSWRAISRTTTWYETFWGGYGTVPAYPAAPTTEHRVAIRVKNNESLVSQDIYIKAMAVGYLT